MRTAILITLTLAALTATARAAEGPPTFVDLQRAVNECSDGKKAVTELKADQDARVKAKAEHEAAKAKAVKERKAAPAAIETDQVWLEGMQRKQAEKTAPIVARMRRILAIIAKARRVSNIGPLQAQVFVVPSADVTDELVRRYDAGEGQATAVSQADEVAALKAKLAALEKRRARPSEASPKESGAALPNLDPRALTATRPNP